MFHVHAFYVNILLALSKDKNRECSTAIVT
jgi:hypothetical protein